MSPRASSQASQEFIRKQPFETNGDRSSKYLKLAIIGVFLSLAFYGAVYLFLDKPYVAVYLTTGDVYFGRLSHTPGFKISDPWFIERSKSGDFALRKFVDAVWKPSNTLDISSNQVVFWNRLPSDSPVIGAMQGKGMPNQNPAATGDQNNPVVNQAPVDPNHQNLTVPTQSTNQKKGSEKKAVIPQNGTESQN